MTPLPPKIDELLDFPEVQLEVDHELWRCHQSSNRPEYFSNAGAGRFDPPRSSRSDFGTCYLAESPLGAFLETLGRFRPLPESLVLERSVSPLTVARPMRLANLLAPKVLGKYGISGDLAVGASYDVPQLWSAALRDAGFDGIYYTARHDPSFSERSVALFGGPGLDMSLLHSVKGDDFPPIPDWLITLAESNYGISILPTIMGGL